MYNFFLEHVKCYHLRSTFDYHIEVGQIIKNIKQVNIIYMKHSERVSIGKYTLSVLNPKNLVTTKKILIHPQLQAGENFKTSKTIHQSRFLSGCRFISKICIAV